MHISKERGDIKNGGMTKERGADTSFRSMQFPWLESIGRLLLGLWKGFYYSGKNYHILKSIQEAYVVQALNLVKAAVTRWLSHGAACKHC